MFYLQGVVPKSVSVVTRQVGVVGVAPTFGRIINDCSPSVLFLSTSSLHVHSRSLYFKQKELPMILALLAHLMQDTVFVFYS